MRFFEDIAVGQRRELGSFTYNADNIKKFAAQFDPQRFHLDEEAGRQSLFGGLAASGWHVGSICMKLLVADGQLQASAATARGEEVAVWGPSPGAFATCAGSSRCSRATPSLMRPRSNRCARRRSAPNGVSCRPATPALTNVASWFSRCWRRSSYRDGMLPDSQNPALIFAKMRRGEPTSR